MAHALDTEEMLRLTTRALDLAFANDVEAALNVFATRGAGELTVYPYGTRCMCTPESCIVNGSRTRGVLT